MRYLLVLGVLLTGIRLGHGQEVQTGLQPDAPWGPKNLFYAALQAANVDTSGSTNQYHYLFCQGLPVAVPDRFAVNGMTFAAVRTTDDVKHLRLKQLYEITPLEYSGKNSFTVTVKWMLLSHTGENHTHYYYDVCGKVSNVTYRYDCKEQGYMQVDISGFRY